MGFIKGEVKEVTVPRFEHESLACDAPRGIVAMTTHILSFIVAITSGADVHPYPASSCTGERSYVPASRHRALN